MKEIELVGIKEKIYYEKIKDLPLYIWRNEKVKGTFCALCVNFGSIDQEFKIGKEKRYRQAKKGIAHFIEHLNFYEPDGSTATDYFAKYGSEVNAFTTFNYTCYHVYTTQEIKDNLNHLLDFVLTPYFTKKNVNKERNIIIEELNMDKDLPDSNLYFTHYQDVFHKYHYKEMITGTEEDVKNTDIEDIKTIYDIFYHPANMFLVVTGNVNPYEIAQITEENLQVKKIPKYKNPKLKNIKEPLEVVNTFNEIEGNVEIPKLKMSLKTPLSNFKNIDNVELRLIISLILNSNFGATSDLKEELMEKDFINYLGYSKLYTKDYLILSITAETKYPKEVKKIIENQFKNLKMTEENLQRKINATIASLVLNYDDIISVNNSIQEEILNFASVIPNVKEYLENITLDKVNKVIEKINTKNLATTILKPSKK